MRSGGVEPIYWACTESGLMDIYNFPGVIYAMDGSNGSTGMEAGFYRHDTKGGGCCRVGGGAGGGSSGRAEFVAACLVLSDFPHPRPAHCGSHRLQKIHESGFELSGGGQGSPPSTFPRRGYTRSHHQGSPRKGESWPLHHVHQNQSPYWWVSQRKGRQMGRRRSRRCGQRTMGWS